MKKGEMSMSMIIMAVIAIIILVIIIFLVTGKGKDVGNATTCPSKGGTCQDGYCATGQALTDEKTGNPIYCPNGKTCCPIMG